MIIHEDPLNSFIPKKEVKFIILGTMVAINARIIDGHIPNEEFFYYNNNRNHFWRVLQYLMNPKIKTKDQLIKMRSIEITSELVKSGNAKIIITDGRSPVVLHDTGLGY